MKNYNLIETAYPTLKEGTIDEQIEIALKSIFLLRQNHSKLNKIPYQQYPYESKKTNDIEPKPIQAGKSKDSTRKRSSNKKADNKQDSTKARSLRRRSKVSV